jgi:hypothetical protein
MKIPSSISAILLASAIAKLGDNQVQPAPLGQALKGRKEPWSLPAVCYVFQRETRNGLVCDRRGRKHLPRCYTAENQLNRLALGFTGKAFSRGEGNQNDDH